MKKISGILFLLGSAVIWGIAFVAQDIGLEYIEPFTFTSVRCVLGGAALFVISLVGDLVKNKKAPFRLTKEEKKTRLKDLAVGGVVCGVLMALAMNIQQIGLVYTTAGKSGFITACYIVLVPIIGLFIHKKCPITVWIAVALAVVGLYFLCLSEGFVGFNKGDGITFGCTVAFAVHILAVDKFVRKIDGIKLACVQCFVCAAISAVPMLILEEPSMHSILRAYIPLLYTGILSAGVAYMFQILGQKRLSPTLSSIVMSLESVVSVIAAWIILGQSMSLKEIIGCVIIFFAILLAQLPGRVKKKQLALSGIENASSEALTAENRNKPDENIASEKARIRAEIRCALKRTENREAQEAEVTLGALRAVSELGAERIAVYLSKGDELSTDRLVKELLDGGKRVYAPVTVGEEMVFTEIYGDSVFKIGAFGIREPEITVTEKDFDVIFLPLLAFDGENNRLGHGKGYYDKFLKTASGVRIGLAFAEQRVPAVPVEATDEKMNEVIYPRRDGIKNI